MADASLRDPWRGYDPRMESVIMLNDKCLGVRMKLSSGERVTMPLGQTSFHMKLNRVWVQPRKAPRAEG